MAVFYLLPPRPLVQQRWQAFLQGLLPGLDLAQVADGEWFEDCLRGAEVGQDVFVLFQDDLPDGADRSEALCDAFGADVGDELVEIRWSGPTEPPQIQRHHFSQDHYFEPLARLL